MLGDYTPDQLLSIFAMQGFAGLILFSVVSAHPSARWGHPRSVFWIAA